MSDEAQHRDPFRCFRGAFLRDAVLIAATVVALAWVGRRFAPGSLPRLSIGMAQALLMAWLVVTSMTRIRRLDELMLKVHLEAIAFAFTATGALLAGWGMLEHAGAPRFEWGLWGWPLMAVLWGVAAMVRTRQYR